MRVFFSPHVAGRSPCGSCGSSELSFAEVHVETLEIWQAISPSLSQDLRDTNKEVDKMGLNLVCAHSFSVSFAGRSSRGPRGSSELSVVEFDVKTPNIWHAISQPLSQELRDNDRETRNIGPNFLCSYSICFSCCWPLIARTLPFIQVIVRWNRP